MHLVFVEVNSAKPVTEPVDEGWRALSRQADGVAIRGGRVDSFFPLRVGDFKIQGRMATMHYMLCKNKVADYAEWRKVFDSHAEAHRDSGLHLLHLLRDLHDPNLVVFLFKVDDLSKARAFVRTPDASDAAEQSGVIGQTEMTFLTD